MKLLVYRNSYQITEDILDNVAYSGIEGVSITPLLRSSNLSHKRLIEFISKLTQSNLINKIETNGKITFIITEKGKIYLDEYKKFSNLAGSFGLEL
jgi:predicted transcriptional regulator